MRSAWIDRGRPAILACALVGVALAGCGDDDSDSEPTLDSSGKGTPAQVRTTRVEVVKGLGRGGQFDPEALYQKLSPGVVTVFSLFPDVRTLLDDEGEGGQGSGFVLDGEGYIATNAHVVTSGTGEDKKRAESVFVEFADGNRVEAQIVGDDPNADVALLKVDPAGLSLTPLTLGSSKDLHVGEPVAAIGSPFGEDQSLSIGVISALNRAITSLTGFSVGDAIQTDAAINPGNSGGPLLSAKGEVLGINAQIRSESGGGEGVGFAIPVGAVKRSLDELRDSGRASYGYLGVSAMALYPQLAERLDIPVSQGALVAQVIDETPAADAGIQDGGRRITFQAIDDVPVGADVIVSVDGRKITRRRDLTDLIAAHSEGDKVELELLRGDERRTVDVELGRRPARAPRR